MIGIDVRIQSTDRRDLLAFVTIPPAGETRVRWSPGNWRCDMCGPSPWPTCAHARAVTNSDTYQIEVSKP